MSILNAMTIDVEDYYHVSNFEDAIPRKSWGSIESRVDKSVDRILELLQSHQVQATFFILGCVAEMHPDMVRRIAAGGHEIACHTYDHRLAYKMGPEEFRRDTARAKSVLEDLIQVPVCGFRATSYSVVKESLWALDILLELGFTYDSSIFPVHHDRYGIPDWSRYPGQAQTPAGKRMMEFPPSTLSLFGYNLPIAGGGYLRHFPPQLIEYGIKRLNNREGQPAIIFFHPWEIDEDQPRVSAGLIRSYRHYHNIPKVLPRIQRLLKRFSFGTVLDVMNSNKPTLTKRA